MFENLNFSIINEHIHNQGTQKDSLTKKKRIAKDYSGFLLRLLFHDYSGLAYDYN
jgi:hypothetical protein